MWRRGTAAVPAEGWDDVSVQLSVCSSRWVFSGLYSVDRGIALCTEMSINMNEKNIC